MLLEPGGRTVGGGGFLDGTPDDVGFAFTEGDELDART